MNTLYYKSMKLKSKLLQKFKNKLNLIKFNNFVFIITKKYSQSHLLQSLMKVDKPLHAN